MTDGWVFDGKAYIVYAWKYREWSISFAYRANTSYIIPNKPLEMLTLRIYNL